MNKNILKHIIRYILIIAVIIVCSIIFKFSSDVSQKSSAKSEKICGIIVDIFKGGKNISEEQRNDARPEVACFCTGLVLLPVGLCQYSDLWTCRNLFRISL